MGFSREQLEQDFLCPKCRGRGALVQEVQFSRSVALVIPITPGRFLAASCGLCGYTELYNQAIAIKAEQTENIPAALATEKAE